MKRILALLGLSVILFSSCKTTQSLQTEVTKKPKTKPTVKVKEKKVSQETKIAKKTQTEKEKKEQVKPSKKLSIKEIVGNMEIEVDGYVLEKEAIFLAKELGVTPINNIIPELKKQEKFSPPITLYKEPNRLRVVVSKEFIFDENDNFTLQGKETLNKISELLTQDRLLLVISVFSGISQKSKSIEYAEKIKDFLFSENLDPSKVLITYCNYKPNEAKIVEFFIYPQAISIPKRCYEE
ncbi:MAG: hypothetical protein ABGX27_05405 [Desulfurobacteriaceae bacterium]